MPTLSVLVAWLRNNNSLFCKGDLSWNWTSLYTFSTVINRMQSCNAYINEKSIDDNRRI